MRIEIDKTKNIFFKRWQDVKYDYANYPDYSPAETFSGCVLSIVSIPLALVLVIASIFVQTLREIKKWILSLR